MHQRTSGTPPVPHGGRHSRFSRHQIISLLILLPALIAFSARTARAQLQFELSTTDQANSNPNEITKSGPKATSLSDIIGEQALWLAYPIGVSDDISLVPSYTVGVTLWASQTDQNLIRHDLSLLYSHGNFYLFGYRKPPAVEDNGGVDTAEADPERAAIVAQIAAIATALGDATLTDGDAVIAHPTGVAADTADAGDDDMADSTEADDSTDTADSSAVDSIDNADTAGAPNAANLLQARLAGRIDAIADTLDAPDDAGPELAARTARMLRVVEDSLRADFPAAPFTGDIAGRIDRAIARLGKYVPPAADAPAAPDTGSDTAYAPVSLSFQPLIRNTRADYDMSTSDDDAGAGLLTFDGGASITRYLSSTDARLLLYNTTVLDAGTLLEQQLSPSVTLWGSYRLTSESYPNAQLFNNVHHDLAAQLRYLPNPSTMLVADASFGLKNFNTEPDSSATDAGSVGEVLADSASTTTLFALGTGIMFRPAKNLVLGCVIAYQATPALHPRVTAGFRGGRVATPGSEQSSISDDIFSWHGLDLQILAECGLPLGIHAAGHLGYNPRDYGRATVVLGGRQITLRDRVDKRTTFELGLTRDVALNAEGTSDITISLTLGAVRNTSTNYARVNAMLPQNDFSQNYLEVGLAWGRF